MRTDSHFRFSMLLMVSFLFSGQADALDQPATAPAKPVQLGLLFQENVSGVATDLEAYRNFVATLPAGSEVAIAYARVGSVKVVQSFTGDLEVAAAAIRPPAGMSSMGPGSPFLAVKEFAKQFPEKDGFEKALVFVSDGLDWNHGDFSGAVSSNPFLSGAINAAEKRGVKVYTIFAPSGRTFARSSWLTLAGQSSLGYLADETGGETFYTGSAYISARSYLQEIAALIR